MFKQQAGEISEITQVQERKENKKIIFDGKYC